MQAVDVVVAGGGVAGLLLSSALAPRYSVTLLEQAADLPRNKYWLTDADSARCAPDFAHCIDRRYRSLDFVAYDGLSATVQGEYCLWNTDQLVRHLVNEISRSGVRILTGHRLYSLSQNKREVVVRANSKAIRTRLLVDCMGFASPLVGAKSIADIQGYYIVHGSEVALTEDISPVGLDNAIIGENPTFFELFPTSHRTAHASIIAPSHDYRPSRSLKGELNFLLKQSHYSKSVAFDGKRRRAYFGVIPVGRLRRPALDRIAFFGEAGQANPAASATGLSRMLWTYREYATAIDTCLTQDTLDARGLRRHLPAFMTPMNRVFQEVLFESLLHFDSDDFRRLVLDLKAYPDVDVNDLMFAAFRFRSYRCARLCSQALLRPRGVLGTHLLKSLTRVFWRKLS